MPHLASPAPPSSPWRHLLTLCLPLLAWVVIVIALSQAPSPEHAATGAATTQAQQARPTTGKTVVVILDSLRLQAVQDHMPHLEALRAAQTDAWRPVTTCSANFTLVCVQTMLEGRQSPFVASLYNFTGTEGSLMSVSGAAHARGVRQKLLSDYTLDSLYGRLADESINVEQWPGKYLEHDLRAIEVATGWIAHDEAELVVLHLIGTDKAAHHDNPGSAEYQRHFSEVDRALQGLYDALDPQRDHLIVTGDHGHDQRGHHTRDSLVIVRSPMLSAMLSSVPPEAPLDQPELAELISAAASLDLHLDYEGRYLGLDAAALEALEGPQRAQLDGFFARQRELLTEAGFQGPTLRAQLEDHARARLFRPFEALARHAPTLLIYLAWLLFALVSWRREGRGEPNRPSLWRATWVASAAALVSVLLGLLLPAWAMGALAALMGLGAWLTRARWRHVFEGEERTVAWVLALLLAGVLVSLSGGAWRDLWHNYGELRWQTFAFFIVVFPLASALLAVMRAGERWDRGALAVSAGMICMVSLPSGVYYYQFGQNITRGFFIGALLWLLTALVRRRVHIKKIAIQITKDRAALWYGAGTLLGAGILLWQKAASWLWHSRFERWLLERGEWASWGAVVLMGGVFVSAMRSGRGKLLALLGWGAMLGYLAFVAKMPPALLASVVAAPMLAATSLALTERVEAWRAPMQEDEGAGRWHERAGVWLAALLLMTSWTMLRGWFIENVEFNFGFDYSKLLGLTLEREVAVVVTAMTALKYAPLLWLGVGAVAGALPRVRVQVLRVAVWALHLKLLSLLLQIVFGALRPGQKLHELALSDALFTLGVVLLSAPAVLGVAWWERRRERRAAL